MSVRALVLSLLVALAASVVVPTSLAATDRKAPRLVGAAMLDRDRDGRADGVRLTFSERVRHVADRDGKYPFVVAGYRIRSVGAARGRTLVLVLAEKSGGKATPSIRYKRTRSKPVRDRAGNQELTQTFRRTRAFGGAIAVPPESPPPPPPNPALPPDTDPDRDGYGEPLDCGPNDPAIHPGAEDLPDLAFVDSNCDGVDGDEAKAVFASPQGNDASPGTKASPKRQIQAAVAAASLTGRYVLAAAGDYTAVTAATGVGIYGGYDQATWSRSNDRTTRITGGPEGLLADGATAVVLQLLSVAGHNDGARELSAYGIRAVNGSSLTLQRVTVTANDGALGFAGANGAAGRPGSPGLPGRKGAVDSDVRAAGGAGGVSPIGRDGGKGGDGKYESRGGNGAPGVAGTPGGAGGAAGSTGKNGSDGQNGASGASGAIGRGGDSSTALASTSYRGHDGVEGIYGVPGEGGGGGGAGGGQTGFFVINGTGYGGSGGGGGGEGGRGGAGGRAGGGSFGIYLHNSTVTVSGRSSITSGNGGAGGRGGNGGPGGAGGAGGSYFQAQIPKEVGFSGKGGDGGNGGDGGGGGGGAGGPSIGIFLVGTSSSPVTDSTVTNGAPGPGGAGGNGGTGPGGAGATGIAAAVYPRIA